MLKTNAFLSLFKAATQRPRVRKWFWLQVYELLPLFTDSSLDFMNYGYAPLDESEHKLEIRPEDEPNRYGIWLYQQLLQSVEVQDQRVLEVGCGRGGGSAFIRSYYCPREVVGVDYSKRAVALCKKSHSAPGLTFVRSGLKSSLLTLDNLIWWSTLNHLTATHPGAAFWRKLSVYFGQAATFCSLTFATRVKWSPCLFGLNRLGWRWPNALT